MLTRRTTFLPVWTCGLLLLVIVRQSQPASLSPNLTQTLFPQSQLPLVLTMMSELYGREPLSAADISRMCAQLWSSTPDNFQKEKLTGVLGYLGEATKICPVSSGNSSLVCLGAVAISNYLCKAMPGIGGSSQQLLRPMDNQTLQILSEPDGLCHILGNVSFQDTLCQFVEKNLKAPQIDCASLPHDGFQNQCNNLCSGDNKRACEIILQSLRTIIYWEEVKKTGQEDSIGPAVELSASETSTPPLSSSDNASDITGTHVSSNVQLPRNATTASDRPAGDRTGDKNNPNSASPNDGVGMKKSEPPNNPIAEKASTSSSKASVSVSNQISTTPLTNKSIEAGVSATSATEAPKNSGKMESKPFGQSPVGSVDGEKTDGQQRKPDTTSNVEAASKDDDYEMEQPPELSFDEDIKRPGVNEFLDDEDDGEKGMTFDEERPEEISHKPALSDDPHPDSHSSGIGDIDSDPLNTHFLFYFMAFVVLSVIGYLVYQRRNRIVALVIEGRSGPSSSHRRRSTSGRDRSSSCSYRKLANNLEEAITSNSVKKSNVIY